MSEPVPLVRKLEIGLSIVGWLVIVATPLIAVGVVQMHPPFLPANTVMAYVLALWFIGMANGVGWLTTLAVVEVVSAASSRISPVRVGALGRVAEPS